MHTSTHTLLIAALAPLVLLFIINVSICGKNINTIAIMSQPGYRQPVIKGSDQIKADKLNQAAQRNLCYVNIVLVVCSWAPLMYALATI